MGVNGLGTERTRPRLIVTAVLVAVAAAARVGSWTHSWGLGQDACGYLEAGKALLDGRVGRDYWPLRMGHPAYPLLIAAGGALGLGLEFAARAISVVASCALVALVHRTWSEWRGGREGAIAAALLAIHPGLAIYGGEIWCEPAQMLVLFLVLRGCVDLWAARRPAVRSAWIGAAFGLLACFKQSALAFAPGAAFGVLLSHPKSGPRRALLAAALAFVLVLLPTALSPQLVEYGIRGQVTRVIPAPDPAMMTEDDRSTVADGSELEDQHAKVFVSSAKKLVTEALPRLVFPWWLFVPAVIVGLTAVVRAGGLARRFVWIATASIAIEWLALAVAVGVQDRYLLFAHLVLVPLAATGLVVTGERLARLPRVGLAVAGLPLALVCAIWVRSFLRTTAAAGATANCYRDAGLRLAALGPDRPRRVLTSIQEVAWHAGIERARLVSRSWSHAETEMVRLGCDGIVAGPTEVEVCPDLAEAAALPAGASWRGMRVVLHLDRPHRISILAR